MPTDKQRREAARRHLERQLKRRADREAARKRFTLIASVGGTLVVIAAVIVAIVVIGKDDDKTPTASDPSAGASVDPSDTATDECAVGPKTAVTVKPATGAAVTFDKVTVKGATDLTGKPTVTAKGSSATKLTVKDLVVGKGQAASPTSCTEVQYDGVLYKGGKEFDSSWQGSSTYQFSLTGVVPGFTQGIGGDTASGIAPMKEGGRRIIIVPADMGYGSAGSPPNIPGNATLVFVVDLIKVS